MHYCYIRYEEQFTIIHNTNGGGGRGVGQPLHYIIVSIGTWKGYLGVKETGGGGEVKFGS